MVSGPWWGFFPQHLPRCHRLLSKRLADFYRNFPQRPTGILTNFTNWFTNFWDSHHPISQSPNQKSSMFCMSLVPAQLIAPGNLISDLAVLIFQAILVGYWRIQLCSSLLQKFNPTLVTCWSLSIPTTFIKQLWNYPVQLFKQTESDTVA